MATPCSKLTRRDKEKMVSYIMEGQRRGVEVGFIKCSDGRYVSECEGDECHLNFMGDCSGGAKVKSDELPLKYTFHTHVEKEGLVSHYFSPNDLRSIRDSGGGKLESLGIISRPHRQVYGCVGYFKNGKPKVRCVSAESVPSPTKMNALLNQLQPDEKWERASVEERKLMKIRAVARLNFESKSCVLS